MSNLYYTCPVIAAYMAKYFGVRFHDGNNGAIEFSLEEECAFPKFELIRFFKGEGSSGWELADKAYIHPDSLSIFEAKAGDAVEFDRWFWDRQRFPECKDYPYQAHYGVVGKFGKDDEWLGISSAGHGWDHTKDGKWSMPFKIIQRNGMPLFMPENDEPAY